MEVKIEEPDSEDPGPNSRDLRLVQAAEETKLIVNRLELVGVYIDSVNQLIRQKGNYSRAVPILLEMLAVVKNAGVKESIVRALGEKAFIGLVENTLINEFRNVPPNVIGGESLKWAIGNTLEIVANDKYLNDFIDLALDVKHGAARQMIVLALGKLKSPQSVDALIKLLDDEAVCGHAAIALGKLRASKAINKLSSMSNHRNKWIRDEVKKSIALINKANIK